jgi:mannose-6-phosphate isomerase
MNLYPLKFVPRFVPKMWGGRKLQELFGKSLPTSAPFGESWEVFDFPPGATGPDALTANDDPAGWVSAAICNGPLAGKSLHELVNTHPRQLLGKCEAVATAHGPQFPLLIKFLDARDDLSVQVHPPPAYVKNHPGAFLKNEAWFVLQNDPGARLLLGAKAGVKRAAFEKALADGTADQIMNAVKVSAGETYYMPSGTLHALGGGIVAYEVQTPSDTTYRVFDFNRVDPTTGRPRKLHVEQALDCIQFDWDAPKNKTPAHAGDVILARAPQWLLAQAALPAGVSKRLQHAEGPIVLTAIAGGGAVESIGVREIFRAGETLVLPPSESTRIDADSSCQLLLAAVPPIAPDQLLPRDITA